MVEQRKEKPGAEAHRAFVMRPFAKSFYRSKAWQKTRAAYAKSKAGLCERCLARGIYTPGEIVHHKEYITPENLSDPMIALNWDNLELLCRQCHADEHEHRTTRYAVDEMGRISPRV